MASTAQTSAQGQPADENQAAWDSPTCQLGLPTHSLPHKGLPEAKEGFQSGRREPPWRQLAPCFQGLAYKTQQFTISDLFKLTHPEPAARPLKFKGCGEQQVRLQMDILVQGSYSQWHSVQPIPGSAVVASAICGLWLLSCLSLPL